MSKCCCNKPLSGIPLGGIGTGSIEIRSDGAFHEWMIFNNPPWCGWNEFMKAENPPLKASDFSFIIRTRAKGEVTTRLLRNLEQEEILYSYHIPHLKPAETIKWTPRFPHAEFSYSDPALPVECKMTAWSPFIPHDVKNSSLPAAILSFKLKNPSKHAIDLSILGLLSNPFKVMEEAGVKNTVKETNQYKGIVFSGNSIPEKHPMAGGELSLSVPGPGSTYEASVSSGFQIAGFMNFFEEFYRTGSLRNNADPPPEPPFVPRIKALMAGKISVKDFYLETPHHFRDGFEQMLLKEVKNFYQEISKDALRLNRDLEARWLLVMKHSLSTKNRKIFNDRIKEDPQINTDQAKLEKLLNELAIPDIKKSIDLPKITPPAGGVCRAIHLKPGKEQEIHFILGWYFPNHRAVKGEDYMGHAYEHWFSDSSQVTEYVIKNLKSLKSKTELFLDSLYSGTLPHWFKDAVNAQLTTIVKNSFYTKSKDFGIWEGLGCCGLATLDVTYYGSFPIIHLFPELEKAQMDLTARFQLKEGMAVYDEYFLAFPKNKIEFEKELEKDTSLINDKEKRKAVFKKITKITGYDPTGRIPHLFPGTFSYVDRYHMIDLMPKFALLAHRDYQWSGDLSFLEKMWPHIKAAIDHNIAQDEQGLGLPYHYGNEATDLPISSQTYDVWDFQGYSSYVCSIWLAALRSTAAMARILKDEKYAEKMDRLYQKAEGNMEKLLWNGEYYDLWNDPPNKQKNEFCMTDQISGQWYMNVLNLPPLFEKKKVVSALKAIARYNSVPERGLINGVLPEGKKAVWAKGIFGLPPNYQSDTPWTGTEYAVAALFIQQGLVKKGLAIVKDVYDRYKKAGLTWNHYECGEHYYRAMSIWNVMQALQGFKYNAIAHELILLPSDKKKEHKSLVVTSEGYGMFEHAKNIRVTWLSGKLTLTTFLFSTSMKKGKKSVKAEINGRKTACQAIIENRLYGMQFEKPINLKAGDILNVRIK
ncbi:MAG: hypothetical protein JW969_18535 [Spirochaetales bacterium]|nr:hypothetical protein [Spirochaetales bacterium]